MVGPLPPSCPWPVVLLREIVSLNLGDINLVTPFLIPFCGSQHLNSVFGARNSRGGPAGAH